MENKGNNNDFPLQDKYELLEIEEAYDDACCENCMFWRRDSRKETYYIGDCRRFPPIAKHTHHHGAKIRGNCNRKTCESYGMNEECWECGIAMSLFPITMDEDWCGEWRGNDDYYGE